METKSVKSIFIVGLKLLIICALVAGVIAFVNAVTEEPRQANIERAKKEALEAIFGEIDSNPDELTADVYLVKKDGVTVGYCAKGIGRGYGGDIELMVGYDLSFGIVGISVVSNSETPGVGSRALEGEYLNAYQGQSGEDVELDALSGATYTSKGVNAGVKDATKRLIAALECIGVEEVLLP